MATTDVNVDTDHSEWALQAILNVAQPSDHAQHCAFYAQANKLAGANANGWAMCTELSDNTLNPSKSSIGYEANMSVRGPDPNSQRFGIHLALGPSSMAKSDGSDYRRDNEIARGLIISTDDALSTKVLKAITLQGLFGRGVDTIDMVSAGPIMIGTDVAIAMRNGQVLAWYANSSLLTAATATLRYDATQQAFSYPGVTATLSVGAPGAAMALPATPAGYTYEIINGNKFRRPYYN